MNSNKSSVAVTGLGAVTPIGIGKEALTTALKEGKTNFTLISLEGEDEKFEFPLGQTNDFDFKSFVLQTHLSENIIAKTKGLRHLSKSTAYGMYCALEAWADATLPASTDMSKVAIVLAGSNTQQETARSTYNKYKGRLQYLTPQYGFSFLDTDLVGLLSEVLGVKGEGHAISAASASGNMGIIQGVRLINSGQYDVVIVVAPLMDLSLLEYQAFTVMGAMASSSAYPDPAMLGRPFDQAHGGFVYGQSAGCLILESETHASQRGKSIIGSIAGYGVCMDANRNPNPSDKGEHQAMIAAMNSADIQASQIDYINTHGTGSVVGDKMEVSALLLAGLEGVKANSTKSLMGHSLSAAGVVEAIASLLQMNAGFLHKSHNLHDPINTNIDWVKEAVSEVNIRYALSNSFGFGGINTAIILKNHSPTR